MKGSDASILTANESAFAQTGQNTGTISDHINGMDIWDAGTHEASKQGITVLLSSQ